MIKLKTLLTETIVNLVTPEDRIEYIDDIVPIMLASYSYVGGYKHASDPESLKKVLRSDAMKDGIWKMSRRNGKIVAIIGYEFTPNGRKAIFSSTDRTPIGKKEFIKLKKDDVRLNRSYSEVSDKMEDFMLKIGAKRVPSSIAAKILNKKIEPEDDGYHYRREIGGKIHRKVMVGFVDNVVDKI